MCEICIKIFNKSENLGISQKSRGCWQIFLLQGGLGKFCCTGSAEPLVGARKSRGGGWDPVRQYGTGVSKPVGGRGAAHRQLQISQASRSQIGILRYYILHLGKGKVMERGHNNKNLIAYLYLIQIFATNTNWELLQKIIAKNQLFLFQLWFLSELIKFGVSYWQKKCIITLWFLPFDS